MSRSQSSDVEAIASDVTDTGFFSGGVSEEVWDLRISIFLVPAIWPTSTVLAAGGCIIEKFLPVHAIMVEFHNRFTMPRYPTRTSDILPDSLKKV
jgi:hypothetical protein